ncbi:MutS protein homolog 4 [Geodia barretti]|uniref:MutS protein homolog 4 n=1 Tax=Geodia barretti TaxID=519541 RepID=A0AA35XER4_GEOBA|nr:MutS protein homolog 4 [Geodia barretti]
MKISKNRNTINFSTADLLRLNDRAQEATKEIYVMTNVVVNELIKDLRSNIGCLYKLAECVSMLDMLHSFAKSCTLSSYVRPEFTDTLAVKQSRHPILDIISFNLVPNNISGKTTYLKQVALLQIMAQVGSFVPAVYASFRVTSQIFSRVGSDDDISSNSSTFMLEMRELSYVLQNVSSNCLVIVDELGRGTSNEEGFGICHAVCEHLLTTKTRLHVCNVTD